MGQGADDPVEIPQNYLRTACRTGRLSRFAQFLRCFFAVRVLEAFG